MNHWLDPFKVIIGDVWLSGYNLSHGLLPLIIVVCCSNVAKVIIFARAQRFAHEPWGWYIGNLYNSSTAYEIMFVTKLIKVCSASSKGK